MFQRTFLRQAQSALSVRSVPTASLAARRTLHFQPQLRSLRPFAPRPSLRSYSTENKPENGAKEGEEAQPQEAEDPVRKELEDKKKEAADMKDKYVRSVADFLNLQERTKRDMDNARNFAIQRFAQDLLESIDNMDRALLAVPKEKLEAPQDEANKDLLNMVDGVKMTQHILMGTLKKHGLERFDPTELVEGKVQKFDPNLHEATFMAKDPSKENGDIMHAQSKGFTLNGRVLRAAKVGVVNND